MGDVGDMGDWGKSSGESVPHRERRARAANTPSPPVSQSPSRERRARRRELNASGAPEPDGDLAPLDDDRDLPAAGEVDHPVKLIPVRQDVDVGERDFSLCVVLTGRGRVGSGVFSEDLDAV